ncbi:MAG TPA: hypothetical protein DEP72_09415 [Clostridiales bacterium]|nr:MAG: hypothetical protein A2Y18_04025 [Clostridiales bacterium GWD2_32_19]HCC08359.1 hypothetical protein [Clostridiales bacterium]
MSNDSNITILSKESESFQYIAIQGHKLILSAEDTFNINEYFGDSPTNDEFLIYAEGILLSKRLQLKSGLISANYFDTTNNKITIDVSGNKGADIEIPNMDAKKSPGDKGGNGEQGGSLNMYIENVNVYDNTIYELLARGGDGGSGQDGTVSTAGGNGGDGQNGGSVQAIIIHPYLRIISTLVSIYKSSIYSKKKTGLRTCIETISNFTALNEVRNALENALSNTKTVEDLNASIYDASTYISIQAKNWESNLLIDVAGGKSGTYGLGKTPGIKGLQGNKGTSLAITIDNTSSLLNKKYEPFMLIHPSQCAMVLEKAKLMYFSINPVEDSKGTQNIAVLLKRLLERTAIFNNLDSNSDLAKYYAKNEQSIGAINSVQSLQQIYSTATNLLNNLANGLDYFGYDSQHVPLTSFGFYRNLLNDLISNFSYIEDEYNSYYDKLKDQKATIDIIKSVKQQQETIIAQSNSSISQLKNNLIESANIIDSYQYTLAPKKQALEDKMKELKDSIEKYFDFNVQSFLSSLTTLAFAPKSKIMWITQIAEVGVKGTEDVTDDKGDEINKDYIVGKIKSVEASVKGLIEGYSEEKDGTLQADDPCANKLIASEEKINDLLDDFYNKFPTEITELKTLFQDYVKTITSRNTEILDYNAIVQLLRKNHQQINEAQKKITSLNSSALKNINPNWPEITAFVSQMYYSSRSIIMEIMDLAARAYGFWSLDDHRNLIAQAYGNRSLPEIDTASFTQVQTIILDSYRRTIEKFGNGAGIFPMNNNDEGIVIKLDKDQIEYFKENKVIMFNIPVALPSKLKTENSFAEASNPFAGACNIRLNNVRVWIKGAKASNDMLQVNICHTGKEQIVDANGNVFSFSHDPKYTMFKYYLSNNKIFQDGGIGWQDSESKSTYALVGPFTYWKIKIYDTPDDLVDLSEVTEVKIEFHGTNYPFKC